jgi:hypothetical protein
MRGEFIAVWPETPREIWDELVVEEGVPNDVFCELYRNLAPALKQQPSVQALADIVDNPLLSRDAFFAMRAGDLIGERDLVTFFEKAHDVFFDFAGDALSNRYFNLLAGFISKFSLRYDLRRPCQLCPTLPGMFAGLVRELRTLTAGDEHLDSLMKDFESTVRDLRADSSEGKIKTCIQKQMNLLEALGRAYPGVTGKTLGVICDQIGTWPHEKLKFAMKDLYGFSCDYPGIRHGGTPASALRAVNMRDMVALSILLTGFTPYLGNNLNADTIFGCGIAPARQNSQRAAFQPLPAVPTATIENPRRLSAGIFARLKKLISGQN